MQTLGIFVKQPTPGRVKTRLGQEIGDAQAATLYAAFQEDLFTRFCQLNHSCIVAYAPIDAERFFKEHLRRLSRTSTDVCRLWPQPQRSLGERLAQFFADHLGAGPVVVIGSDSPTLPTSLIEQAFDLLTHTDAVIGPAVDGGYYLIGLRVPMLEVFDGIDWSTATVLQQTVQKVHELQASLAVLAPWYDVDSLEDLQFLYGHLQAMRVAHSSAGDAALGFPRKTFQVVESLLRDEHRG